MFLVSNTKKFFYKVSDIKSGTTSKGDPYCFISISNKKRDSGEYENAKIMFWGKVDNVEKGDYVAVLDVSGWENYSFQPTGSLKTYLGTNISTTKIEIKKAEKTEETQSNPQEKPSVDKTLLEPIDDDNLPF